MLIAPELLDELVAHARSELPNESCGIVGVIDGTAVDFYPARNRFESPMRFEIHPDDLYRISQLTDSRGQEMAVFHSHPNSEASPSQTDINLASWWPGLPWIICSLAADEAVVRGFEIQGTAASEIELVAD
jgi:[CysO sulfur-carrier protein]-S-L-cysteine hydrolase